jgi:hypothetical protein
VHGQLSQRTCTGIRQVVDCADSYGQVGLRADGKVVDLPGTRSVELVGNLRQVQFAASKAARGQIGVSQISHCQIEYDCGHPHHLLVQFCVRRRR